MNIYEYYDLFKKYKYPLALIFGFCITAAVLSFSLLPRKYKSVGTLSISIRYFQNPLIREFVTETYDNQEIRAQREALIIGAISDQFVDDLAFKYHLYDRNPILNSKEHFYQRSLLRKKIEIIPLNPSTSQISFYSTNPKLSHEVVKQIFEQIRQHLGQMRKKYLINLRMSMKNRIDVLMTSIDYSVDINHSDSDYSKNPMLIGEREKIKLEIQKNLKYFNSKHPVLARLYKKLSAVESQITELNKSSLRSNVQNSLTSDSLVEDKEKMDEGENELLLSNSSNLIKAKNSVYEDLVRKFEYLNIAINSETSDSSAYLSVLQNPTYPIDYVFPNKTFFIVWALIGGLLLSCLFIGIAENLNSHRQAAMAGASKQGERSLAVEYTHPAHSFDGIDSSNERPN